MRTTRRQFFATTAAALPALAFAEAATANATRGVVLYPFDLSLLSKWTRPAVKLHGDPQPALDEYGAAFKQP